MTRQEINQALEKQLKILADKSATGAADLASLAGAAETMLHISFRRKCAAYKSKSLFLLLFSKMIPISHRNNPDCRNMTNISPARSVSLSAFISSPMMMRATPSLSLMTL